MKLTVAGNVTFEEGRITFNPVSGVDPIDLKPILDTSAKGILLAILGAGVVESVSEIAKECGITVPDGSMPDSIGTLNSLHNLDAATNHYMEQLNDMLGKITA